MSDQFMEFPETDAPKYATGLYLIYPFNKLGVRLKGSTRTANSLTEADDIGSGMLKEPHIQSYVVMRVVRNSGIG